MKLKLTLPALVLILSVFAAGSAAFGSDLFNGTIEGADCVINQLNCAKDINDPHLAMERDFVLVTGDGKYFFMPNLRRIYKELAYKKQVRIKGTLKGKAIVVEKLEVLTHGDFFCSWDQVAEMKAMNKR